MADTFIPRIERSNRRTIALQISRRGEIIVKAPLFAPMHVIQIFIDRNKTWIEAHVPQSSQQSKNHTYTDGDTFLYLGKQLRLTVGAYPAIAVVDDALHFPHALLFRAEKEIERFYIKEAKRVITQQVTYFATQMGVRPQGALTFSDTTSQWGRCTHDNRLQFSWRLIMAPLLTLNYVVVHELTHITEKNHSRAFWSRVRLYNPSYRHQLLWLKKHGNSLF